jgi:superfamily II DNA helicase RecQ
MRRAINQAPPEINTKLKRITEVVKHDLEHGTWVHRKTGETHKGKPSIIFTDSAQEAKMIHAHLESEGVRAALYHGGLTNDAREKVRRGALKPPKGATPTHDVVVATSAMEAGVNAPRMKVIHHGDMPLTEKSHNQRSGRAYRQGQDGDVEVHNYITDTDYDDRAQRRLKRKEGLASVWQDNIASMDERGIAARYSRILAERHQAADSSLAAK